MMKHRQMEKAVYHNIQKMMYILQQLKSFHKVLHKYKENQVESMEMRRKDKELRLIKFELSFFDIFSIELVDEYDAFAK